MTTLNRDALRRTADWLEANPDKHTSGAMARRADGAATSPYDPEAVCFCALGRLAIETQAKRGFGEWWMGAVRRAAGLSSGISLKIVEINDSQRTVEAPDMPEPGASDVIPYLRGLAA